LKDLVGLGVKHVGRGADHPPLGVDTDFGDAALIRRRAPGGDCLPGASVLSHSDADTWAAIGEAKDFGANHRGDADQAYGLSGGMKFLHHAFDLRLDAAGRTFEGKGAKVFGSAKAAGEDHGIKICGVQFRQVSYFAPADAGGFDHLITSLARFDLSGDVVDDMMLGGVEGKAAVRRAGL